MSPELKGLYSSDQEFLSYADTSSASSISEAINYLESFVEVEGPFDGVMAFPQGAGIAATLIVKKKKQDPVGQALRPLFKCAIFFSGIPAADPEALLANEVQILEKDKHGEVIDIPTAHIWGTEDESLYGSGLSQICTTRTRSIFVWNAGHEIPQSKTKEALTGAVQVIRRAIHEATLI